MKKLFFYLFLSVLVLENFAGAQSIKSAYVYSEEDDESNVKCQYSNASGVAATQSALRYNRVEVFNSFSTNNINFYINVNNFEATNQSCTFAIELQAYVYARVSVPGVSKQVLLKSLICSKGSAGMLNKMNIQDRLNQRLKSWVDLCISEFDKKIQ